MNKFLLAMAVALTAIWSHAAEAAVISRDWKTPGDGLLTYDDVNQREWLDLSQTLLTSQFPGTTRDQRFQYVINQTVPGGLFAGFVNATSAEVIALAQSAGIVTIGQPSPANVPAVSALGELLSYTFVSPPTGNGNKGYIGFLADVGPSPAFARFGAIFVVEIAATPDRAVLRISSNDDGLTSPISAPPAVFLARSVPEPSSIWLGLLSLGRLALRRRNKAVRHPRVTAARQLQIEALEDRRVLAPLVDVVKARKGDAAHLFVSD